MVTYIVAFFSSVVLTFASRKIRIKGIDGRLWGLIPFIILIIFAKNTPDHHTYEVAYTTGVATYFESGPAIIHSVLEKIGLDSFIYFKLIVAILVVFTFSRWGKRIERIESVILLYNAFVLYYDVIQMRYTIAVMLVLLSLYYIVEKRMIKAIFCGVLSLFFHRLVSIGIIFAILVYIIKPRADYKLRFKENAVIVLSGVGGIVFSKAIVSFIAIWIPFFQRINLYMTRYKSYDSLIIWAGYEAFILVVLYCLAYKRYISDNRIAATNKVVINTLYRFMFYGIAISGILLYVEEFNRIYRLFYLVGYMVYGMIEPQFCKKNNRSVVFWVLLFGSVVFMFVAIYRGLNFDLYW